MKKNYLIVTVLILISVTSAILFTLEKQPQLVSKHQSKPITHANSPIKHIIFIVQENHSFDNYFGTYPGANGITSKTRIPLNPKDTSLGYVTPFKLNPAQAVILVGDELAPGVVPQAVENKEILSFHIDNEFTYDIDHSSRVAHEAWDNGKMDGFVYAEKSKTTMGYYDNREIPYYWYYADNFVLDDNFFSSAMGPSLPNHLYIASGNSGNITGDIVIKGLHLTWSTLAEELTSNNIDWAWYDGSKNAT